SDHDGFPLQKSPSSSPYRPGTTKGTSQSAMASTCLYRLIGVLILEGQASSALSDCNLSDYRFFLAGCLRSARRRSPTRVVRMPSLPRRSGSRRSDLRLSPLRRSRLGARRTSLSSLWLFTVSTSEI